LKLFTVLKYILLFRIFEELAVALKTEFALKFFNPGGAAALPAPPPRTPMTTGRMKINFFDALDNMNIER